MWVWQCPECGKQLNSGKSTGGIKCDCGFETLNRADNIISEFKVSNVPKKKKSPWLAEQDLGGTGTNLKRILGKMPGIPSGGCGCQDYAQLMDRSGATWCEENRSAILARLEEQAKKLNIKYFNKIAVSVALGHCIAKAKRQKEKKLAIIIPWQPNYNLLGWESRRNNFLVVYNSIIHQGGDVWVIECAAPGQPPVVETDKYIRCESASFLWQKERLINLANEKLPEEYGFIAWMDGDCTIDDPLWVETTINLLKRYPVVQISNKLLWINKYGNPELWPSGKTYREGLASKILNSNGHYNLDRPFGQEYPGLGWATWRDLLKKHTHFERNIIGGGDCVFVAGLYGWWGPKIFDNIVTDKNEEYVTSWAKGMYKDVQGDVGFVPSVARHLFHSTRKDRMYVGRYKLLGLLDLENELCVNKSGALEFSDTVSKDVREQFREYYLGRQEDNYITGVV